MANEKINDIARKRIIKEMAGLDGTASSNLAKQLAKEFNVNKSTIYKITEECRPKRRTRTDKGKRKESIVESPFLSYAIQLILVESFPPDEAFEKAKEKGFTTKISLATFKKYLINDGIWRSSKPIKIKRETKKKPIVLVLDEDVAEVFKDAKTVNTVLRNLLTITKPSIKHPQT